VGPLAQLAFGFLASSHRIADAGDAENLSRPYGTMASRKKSRLGQRFISDDDGASSF